MADPIQAEKWEDLLPAVKKLHEAANRMPAAPRPDDQFSLQLNQIKRSAEGLNELIHSRVEAEQEQEMFRP